LLPGMLMDLYKNLDCMMNLNKYEHGINRMGIMKYI